MLSEQETREWAVREAEMREAREAGVAQFDASMRSDAARLEAAWEERVEQLRQLRLTQKDREVRPPPLSPALDPLSPALDPETSCPRPLSPPSRLPRAILSLPGVSTRLASSRPYCHPARLSQTRPFASALRKIAGIQRGRIKALRKLSEARKHAAARVRSKEPRDIVGEYADYGSQAKPTPIHTDARRLSCACCSHASALPRDCGATPDA